MMATYLFINKISNAITIHANAIKEDIAGYAIEDFVFRVLLDFLKVFTMGKKIRRK